MKPVLTIFIDSLKPESLEYMPFLNSFSTKKRMKTELGYSLTCHSSFYTGVHPDKHLTWVFWKYSPNSSPFKWINKSRIYKLPHNNYTKFACFMLTKIFYGSRRISGIPLRFVSYWGLWHTPMKYWHYLEPTEYKQSIFDVLPEADIEFEVVYEANDPSRFIERRVSNQIKPWTYIFIVDIDPLTHKYGQDSAEARKRLGEIDNILQRVYEYFDRQFSDFYFICFSDHGQSKIEDKIDINSIFRSHGSSLNDYIHFIDSTFARFWFRDEKEEAEVRKILAGMTDKGFILEEEHFEKYHIEMPDNRYGDLIFYLDKPYAFDHGSIKVMGKVFSFQPDYMHGYLPDYVDSDGIFVSNKQVLDNSYVELVDIMPSILDALDVAVPDYVDGKVLWK